MSSKPRQYRAPQSFVDEVMAHAKDIAEDLYLFGLAAQGKGSADQELKPIDPKTLVISNQPTPPILSGWKCPICERGVSPFTTQCHCRTKSAFIEAVTQGHAPCNYYSLGLPCDICGLGKYSAGTPVPDHVCQPSTTGGCATCGKTGSFIK